MNAISNANTFFEISTIGFIIIFILIIIGLLYLISLLKSIARIVARIEKDMDNIGDTAKELVMRLWDSRIFSWLFGAKKRRKNVE
jgi:uncharacterized membrane protein